MANNMQSMGLDASQFLGELTKVQQGLKAHAGTVTDITTKYVEFNESGKAVEAAFKGVLSTGEQVNVLLKKNGASFDALVTSVEAASKSFKDMKAAQLGAADAKAFMPNVEGLKASIVEASVSAQKALATVLGGDSGNLKIAQELFAKMKAGTSEAEFGIRGKIQAALFDVLKLSERVGAEIAKIASRNAVPPPPPPEKVGMGDAALGMFKQQLLNIYPAVPNATLSSVMTFQAALNSLMGTVARGKLTAAEFQDIFSKVAQNPKGDFSGTNQQLLAVETSIKRVIAAHQAMDPAAKASAQSGTQSVRSLYVSFEQFVKLLQVQVIHRFFGAMLTGIQQSLGKAAELKVKLAEVLTVAQGSGFDETSIAAFVRSRSEMSNRSQTDVTEGLYQAFSNQIIRSTSDVTNFDQALRLSRITASTVADSVNLLSSVIRSYNQSNVQAESTVNSLFRAVELGRFRVADLADTFGRVSVVGSQMGVELNELLAILAHLSITGLRPAEAETQISAIMNAFMRPSQEMRNVLRSWGFESGESAVRVLTLTGAIARLNQEVLSGRHNLSELTPNIRAIRGITGARDTGALSGIQNQLDGSSGPANAADELMRNNPGTRFQVELEKIKNMMLEFGTSIITEIERISKPWGGFANATKMATDSVKGFISAGMSGVNTLNALVALIRPLGGDLGTLIKLWIDWKIATISWSVVTTTASTVTAIHTRLSLAASSANSAAAATTLLHAQAVGMDMAALGAHSGVVLQNTAAKVTNNQVTLAGVAASRLGAAALAAWPVAAAAVGIAALTGQFDGLLDRITGVTAALERITTVGEAANSALRNITADANREIADRERTFERTVRNAERAGGLVFAELTRRATQVVEAQRTVVATTTENLRVAMRGASDEMRTVISDLNRRITEARSQVRESMRRALSFGDRDQADNFRRSLEALSRRPEFVNPINQQDQQGRQEAAREELRYSVERQQFAMSQELIQRRITQLQEEARQLSAAGDAESMQSARRKFEEIRRLTEDSFTRQTDFNRRTAEHNLLLGGGPTDGIARYTVPIQQLQQQLDALTRSENQAEQAYQSRMERRRQADTERLAQEHQRQQLLNDTIRQFEQFSVLDANNGRVRERFRGRQGMANLNEDWRRMQTQLDQAMQGANFSPEARLQTSAALLQQFNALRGQLERERQAEALQNEQNLFNRRFENQRALNVEVSRTSTDFTATRTTVVENTTRNLAAMLAQVNNATNLIPRGDALQDILTGNRVSRFRAAAPGVTNAVNALANASTMDEQRVALERLANAVAIADRAYRDLFGLAGNRNLNNSPLTGNQVAGQETALRQNVTFLRDQFEAMQDARSRLQAATIEMGGLQNQINQAAIGIGANINNVGGAINQQAPVIDNFAATIGRLADSFERLRAAVGLPVVPAVPAMPGFASGGLIGGRFNTFGPDNMLAAVRTGEFVMNPESTSRFYSQLVAMNAGQMPSFASGGMVGSSNVTNVGDISITVPDSGNPNATARAVLGTLRREFRRGNGRL